MTITNTAFLELEGRIKAEILERDTEVHTAIIAILANRHHFQYGEPGVAKSLLVERLNKRIDGATYFKWLLSKYTTPEEIFGGVNFKVFKESGIYKRVTEGKLPVAHFGFLDEIFKANSAILNAMLMAMNERLFINPGDDPNIPLISIFGASNEMPTGEELAALWDRLHIRHIVEPIREAGNFQRMLLLDLPEDPEPVVSVDDVLAAQKAVKALPIPEDVLEAMMDLRASLRAENVRPTDRRWRESLAIIQAQAWLAGRDHVTIDDCQPLIHVLWNEQPQFRTVVDKVLDLINPLDRKALDIYENVRELSGELNKVLADADNPKVKTQKGVEVYHKLQKMKKTMDEIKDSGRSSEYIDRAQSEFKRLAIFVLEDVLDAGTEGTNI